MDESIYANPWKAAELMSKREDLHLDGVTTERITTAVVEGSKEWSALQWDAEDAAIKRTLRDLDREGCQFLVAYNTSNARRHEPSRNFAILPDGQIVGVDLQGATAADNILQACGMEASAGWWAQIITRFGGIGQGDVITSSDTEAKRGLETTGAQFAPPILTQSADESRTVEFFMRNPVRPIFTFLYFKVTATLPQDGQLELQLERLN